MWRRRLVDWAEFTFGKQVFHWLGQLSSSNRLLLGCCTNLRCRGSYSRGGCSRIKTKTSQSSAIKCVRAPLHRARARSHLSNLNLNSTSLIAFLFSGARSNSFLNYYFIVVIINSNVFIGTTQSRERERERGRETERKKEYDFLPIQHKTTCYNNKSSFRLFRSQIVRLSVLGELHQCSLTRYTQTWWAYQACVLPVSRVAWWKTQTKRQFCDLNPATMRESKSCTSRQWWVVEFCSGRCVVHIYNTYVCV